MDFILFKHIQKTTKMTIVEIDDISCILGYHEDSQKYWDGGDDLYTWGYCPVCDELIVCDFNKGAPSWVFGRGEPTTGSFEVDIVVDPWYGCPENCIFYRHHFKVTYTGINTGTRDFTSIRHVFNQIIPFKSSVTGLLLEQAALLKWYEKEISDLADSNITFPNEMRCFKKILSWDNPMKCELFDRFASKTCKDIAICIVSFHDWLIDLV